MKLIIVVNVDWFFLSHRLPIALEAKRRGYEVTIVAIDTGCGEKIRGYGFRFIPLPTDRKGLNIFREMNIIRLLLQLYRKEKPDVVHHVALKPVIYGSIAAKFCRGIRFVNAISGMGYLFSNSEKRNVLRGAVLRIFRFAFNNKDLRFIFQNEDDRALILALGVVKKENTFIIEGSGIDLEEFGYTPEPSDDVIRVTFTGRFLRDKGVVELVEAARIIKREFGSKVEIWLVGDVDLENRASLTSEMINQWQEEGIIKWGGYSTDIYGELKKTHIMVLPSYREGLPKSLIEACAVGRAIVTTDVPGCRDVVENGVNGLLVPPRNVPELAKAIRQLVVDKDKRVNMGKKGREIAEKKFSISSVLHKTFSIYEGN